jgi:hypothetical protein
LPIAWQKKKGQARKVLLVAMSFHLIAMSCQLLDHKLEIPGDEFSCRKGPGKLFFIKRRKDKFKMG